MKHIYFAHPVNVYNTELERGILAMLMHAFPGVEIENPNQPHHQEGYRAWKKRYEGHLTKSGMNYFYEIVLPGCDSVAALPFLDDKWGAGVAGETIFFIERNQPAWVVDSNPPWLGIRKLTKKEEHLLITKDPSLVLGIEETRFRTWGRGEPYITMVPFEQAHHV